MKVEIHDEAGDEAADLVRWYKGTILGPLSGFRNCSWQPLFRSLANL